MGKQVPEEIKEERFERLMQTQSEVSFTKNKSLIGSVHEGFVESVENGNYVTRIASQAPEVDGYTYIKRDRELILGDLIDIRITDADIYDLHGEVVE
jgi:ribosomal protein S12 methylthiotransferase